MVTHMTGRSIESVADCIYLQVHHIAPLPLLSLFPVAKLHGDLTPSRSLYARTLPQACCMQGIS